jgi:hypothetical protein
MGVRINMVTDHQITHWDDSAVVIEKIAPALKALRAVESYWRGVR